MGVENTRGNIAAKVMMPTQVDSPVISHASQPRATINAHAAAPEQVVAIHMVRKSAYFRPNRNRSLVAARYEVK